MSSKSTDVVSSDNNWKQVAEVGRFTIFLHLFRGDYWIQWKHGKGTDNLFMTDDAAMELYEALQESTQEELAE